MRSVAMVIVILAVAVLAFMIGVIVGVEGRDK